MISSVVASHEAGVGSTISAESVTTSDSAALVSTDIGYDGDAESVARNISSKETRKNVTSEGSKSTIASEDEDPVSPTDVTKELANDNIEHAPEIPAKSLSAAVQVATMQASFAEKTSSEMQEIIGWYEATASEERFTKVDQRDSLPNNAMVYDLDDSEFEKESEDNETVGDNGLCDGNRSPGYSSGVNSSSPLPVTRRPSSHKKAPRSSQIREHLKLRMI